VDSLGLMVRASDGGATKEQRELLVSLYAVAVFLMVLHHQVGNFTDTITLPFMPPWALASLEAVTRTIGTRWKLHVMVVCTALLNGKVLNHVKISMFILMYFSLYWPIRPVAQFLCSAITGWPLSSLYTDIGPRYFLPIIIVGQLLLEMGQHLPFPWLQCLAVFALAIAWHALPPPFGPKSRTMPFLHFPWLGNAMEPIWCSMCNGILLIALYLTVGYYGQRVFSRFMTYQATKSKTSQCVAAALALSLLLSLLVAHVWNTTSFLSQYASVCGQKLHWSDQPRQIDVSHLLEAYIAPQSTSGWLVDFVYNLTLLPLLALAIAPFAPWFSVLGQYAWGIYCAQGLFFYCKGPDGLRSFGITVRGVVVLPRLQEAVAAFAGYGCIQLFLIASYAVVCIVVVCIPFHMANSFFMRCFSSGMSRFLHARSSKRQL